jgi:hypothetical protein
MDSDFLNLKSIDTVKENIKLKVNSKMNGNRDDNK